MLRVCVCVCVRERERGERERGSEWGERPILFQFLDYVSSLVKIGMSFTAVGRVISVSQLFYIPQQNVCTEDT